MKDFDAIIHSKAKWINLVWQVNNWCNYRCSYCSEGNWGGRYKNEDNIDVIVDTLEKIVKYYQDQGFEYFKLFLSGGEPTYWKGLIPVVTKFRELVTFPGSCVGINTNFSRPLSWWEENHQLFDDVVASYHAESVDDDKYMQSFSYLQDKKKYLCSRVMMHKNHFQQCVDISERIKAECDNYIIEYAPVYDELRADTAPYHYEDPAHIEFFKTHVTDSQKKVEVAAMPNYAWAKIHYEDGTVGTIDTNKIIVENKNFFKGWTCNIHESLHIHANGTIQQASCGIGPISGNIVKGIFDTNTVNSIVCPKDHCHCAADFSIAKCKPGNEDLIK